MAGVAAGRSGHGSGCQQQSAVVYRHGLQPAISNCDTQGRKALTHEVEQLIAEAGLLLAAAAACGQHYPRPPGLPGPALRRGCRSSGGCGLLGGAASAAEGHGAKSSTGHGAGVVLAG